MSLSQGAIRPLKRTRNDDDRDEWTPASPDPVEDIAHDEEFWFDDGSIILIAGSIAFKVYKGLLAAQSPVFADMLATVNPQASQTFEGCPVVRLADNYQDWMALLRWLGNPEYVVASHPPTLLTPKNPAQS